ncbi:MAG: cbb3-type cytochrome c oxidase subunit I [Myxococcaceae bacterium]|nr:cbb3-type cytochrome c oxidase subunit I [Myxococcaceae bacterium]
MRQLPADEASHQPPRDGVAPAHSYLDHGTTVWSWLTTKDHKRIGVMFLGSVLLMFFMGGVFALLLRLELLQPQPSFFDGLTYNRLFTLHGVTMVWLFLIPSIPTTFGNFCLPLMLGAKDLAFPRLNLASLYLYWFGALVTLFGMFQGGTDTGWTFYTPYSTTSSVEVLPVLVGIFILGFSTILTGVNFIVSTHLTRAKGLTWRRIPLFVWTIYGTSIIQVLATPVLAITLALVGLDAGFGIGLFDPQRGGDPVLYQHLFWFYSHPAVYIMILPGMGVVSELVCAFARKNISSYAAIVISTLGIAFVGFFTWGHHMFVAGQSVFDAGAFGVLSMLVAIFTAVKILTWTTTLYRGSIAITAPFVYVAGFIFLLFFGGMSGVALATTSIDIHWHDTYFVVAHFHFIMVGASLMAFFGALHYWFPKMFGRRYPEGLGIGAAVLIVFGFIATFLPQFLLGNAGMPRRYFTYPEQYQPLHVTSTAGASLLGFGFLIIALYLAWSLRWGKVSGANPWGSRGYEWLTPSPPPLHNFHEVPTFERDVHDYTVPEAGHGA